MPIPCTCAGKTARRFSEDVYFALAEELIRCGGAELFLRVMPGISHQLKALRHEWSHPYDSVTSTSPHPQASA
jgi:hypothetical protein